MGAVQRLEPDPFTLADLDALPADGRQHELVDGLHLVTPAPTPLHQSAVGELYHRLRLGCPRDLKVFPAPLDFRPTPHRSLQPDVLVVRREDIGPKTVERPLLLAVEVLSPATRAKDLLLKRGLYEDADVLSYWIFDPDQEQLTVLELVDGRYVERAVVKGSDAFEAELPFPVRIVPAELVD
ncbi:Uma2 family endonuclease [Kribbella qitaiheensis]|uniref:Uma2 family endonuclease n=1 Tax=Kribbella qitaiheensis TaxID=1544730 RepID=A0A7G6WWI8_9ACTN|nr:Uma2 family endonuclease [Kribbella qitaiheensis]QNE18353.1 Uma2 family endonuclease [Kribbella qitaiheensis]